MRRFGLTLLVCLATLGAWVVYAILGWGLSRWVAAHFGTALLRVGQGKFSDVALFVHQRSGEALWLATAGLVLLGALRMSGLLCRRLIKERYRGLAGGLAGFVVFNIWIGIAMHTVLFWSVLGIGSGFQNLMQFNIKRLLLQENPAPHRAVLMGSSQTQAQIDEDTLNQVMGTNLWTTELHFPGSAGYDVLLVSRCIKSVRPELIVCYLSEGYFYSGFSVEAVPNFFGFGDVVDGWKRGIGRYAPPAEVASGLLGDILPIYRCRQVWAARILGPATADLKQEEYDASLQVNLEQRAEQIASQFRIDDRSRFQKRAFEDFVSECQKDGVRLILVAGGYNPILACRINPSVRADMLLYLENLQKNYSMVTVIPQENLAQASSADYKDLSHVNKDMQERFSRSLASRLASLQSGKERP